MNLTHFPGMNWCRLKAASALAVKAALPSAASPLLLASVLFGALHAPGAFAAGTAFTNVRILPITAAPIENGVVLFDGGKITALGPAGSVDIPGDARVLDLAGHTVMPGIVDTHSHLGVQGDSNERSDPMNPQMRILDAFWSADPRIKVAVAGGVTTANVMPGSGNVMGGQTIYVKLRGATVEDMLVPGSIGGLKMANGENPKGRGARSGKAPGTRMAVAALARQRFYDAIAYGEKKAAAEDSRRVDAPETDLALEALLEVLDGRRIVHHHTHRTDDIMTVLRLQEEFGFRLVIQHGIEAWKLADELAQRGPAMVSYILVDSQGGKQEALNTSLNGAAILEQAGLEIALHSDDWIIDSRFLVRTAALAVRGGMSREGALRALTINGARMMDLEDRVGSLEVGKDADFVVFDGDPLSIYTHVQQTWIDGVRHFDRSDPEQRLYATGGYRVADRYPATGEAQ
jgi:imidazolonepropionase-like amidohydrolase